MRNASGNDFAVFVLSGNDDRITNNLFVLLRRCELVTKQLNANEQIVSRLLGISFANDSIPKYERLAAAQHIVTEPASSFVIELRPNVAKL